MIRYMLDTNIVSYIARGPSFALAARLAQTDTRQTCASVLTEAETLFGLAKRAPSPQLESVIREILGGLNILPWTSNAARTYATLRAATESSGLSLAAIDLLIAAHALAEDCVLVTTTPPCSASPEPCASRTGPDLTQVRPASPCYHPI